MVAKQAKPMNERGVTPPKGRLTWMAIIGVALFVLLLLAVTIRPAVDRQDGAESATTTAAPAASSAPTDAGVSSAPTEPASGR